MPAPPCDQCTSIDWDAFFRHDGGFDAVFLNGSAILNGATQGCGFCQLLRKQWPGFVEHGVWMTHTMSNSDEVLRLSGGTYVPWYKLTWPPGVPLVVAGAGRAPSPLVWHGASAPPTPECPASEPSASRRALLKSMIKTVIEPFRPSRTMSEFLARRDVEVANLDLARQWISNCTGKHVACRSSRTRGVPMSIRFVDTATSQVVSGLGPVRYAALSYVWGSKFGNSSQRPQSLANAGPMLPLIRDSIKVAGQLGYKYLWIDQYCISQNNLEEMQHQISRMDDIYSAAEVTIVVACGSGAHCDIPGVGMAKRSHPDIEVNGYVLANLPTDPGDEVDCSLWNSRGWTFQEDKLSQRVLYLTDTQLLFRCQRPGVIHTEFTGMKDVPFRKRIRDRFDESQMMPMMSLRGPPDAISTIALRDYTRRVLTFDGDRLRAFTGVLNRLEKEYEIVHLYGCMLSKDAPVSDLARWLAVNFFYRPIRRVPTLPSWSWAGWANGDITVPLRATGFTSPDLGVALELRRGGDDPAAAAAILPWTEFQRRVRDRLAEAEVAVADRPDYHANVAPILYIWARATGVARSSADPTEFRFLDPGLARWNELKGYAACPKLPGQGHFTAVFVGLGPETVLEGTPGSLLDDPGARASFMLLDNDEVEKVGAIEIRHIESSQEELFLANIRASCPLRMFRIQ